MEFVKFKRQLAKVDLEKHLLQVLDERIKSLPNYAELRLNPEMILLCCNLIENGCKKKDKIQKKDLALRVLTSVFSYNPVDTKNAGDTIEFLHANKRIKRIKMIKKIGLLLLDYIKRKWL